MGTKMSEQINSALMRSYKRAENLDGPLLDETFVPIPQINDLLSTPSITFSMGVAARGRPIPSGAWNGNAGSQALPPYTSISGRSAQKRASMAMRRFPFPAEPRRSSSMS